MKDMVKVVIRGKEVNIDRGCVPMVNFFNSIGFNTKFCCQGHEGESLEFNIMFEEILSQEDIVDFIKHFRNQHNHTSLWGKFKLWCREINGNPSFNWIYEAPNLGCANEDLEKFKKADLSKDFIKREGIKILE